MNVLIVTTPGTFPILKGGVDVMVATLSKAFSTYGNVSILVPSEWGEPGIVVQDSEYGRVHKIRMRQFLSRKRITFNSLVFLLFLPITIFRISKIVINRNIDLIHVNYPLSNHVYIRIISIILRTPYIVTFHGTDVREFGNRTRWESAQIRWLLRGAAKINAVSQQLARESLGVFPYIKNVEVIHNGVDFSQIRDQGYLQKTESLLDAMHDLPEIFYIIVGALVPVKNHEVALNAWVDIGKREPDTHLVIVGDGELRDELKGLTDVLGCADTVHFIGAQARPVVMRILGRARGMIVPSKNEGLGYVVLEAGASSLPVICSKTGPFLEILVDEESGLLFPPDDPKSLARLVVRINRDQKLRERLGRNLRKSVVAAFGADNMANKYYTIYKQAIFSKRDGSLTCR